MEFMMTYGWAILILVVVIATLYKLGVFSQGSSTPDICALPADIGCVSATLIPNGLLTVNIEQATQYTINVVAIGCNDQIPPPNMIVVSPPTTIPIGGNATFKVPCYHLTGNSELPYSSAIGQSYKGYLIINYTDLTTGFTHIAHGTLIETIQ
jgi:hypothetical protein